MEFERDNTHTVKILEVCKVFPWSTSPNPASTFSLSLTCFDFPFLNFPPINRLFFFPLTHSDSDPSIFFHSIVPKLKHSLSLTLQHFLPVAGNLVWPESSPKPFILYTPNDGVSFTVAETDSNFNLFSSNQARELREYRSLVATIQPAETQVPMLSLQVTKFPNGGFSIGFASHHVLFDGHSVSIFWKAWAHICKHSQQSTNGINIIKSESYPDILPELTPSFDRDSAVFQSSSAPIPQNKSLKFSSSSFSAPSNWFHGAFELTGTHIEKLKKRVLETLQNSPPADLHLSTLVVAYAYVLICLIKAQQQENDKFIISLAADARPLLEPPIMSNYFGNCLRFAGAYTEEVEEEGFPNIAKTISSLVLELKNSHIVLEDPDPSELQQEMSSGVKISSIASSPKFKYYEVDFGWGKPKKIHIASLGENSISLHEASDGGGAVEIGIVLPTLQQIHTFASFYSNGLN